MVDRRATTTNRRSFLAAGHAISAAGKLLLAQPQAVVEGHPFPRWDLEDRAVYLADMSHARPAEGLSSDGRKGTWKVLPYETATVKGTMVFSGPTSGAPELELDVKSSGWHALFLGINYCHWKAQLLKVRLSSDPVFSLVVAEEMAAKDMIGRTRETEYLFQEKQFSPLFDVTEVFWKAVKLTGAERLIIARKHYAPARLWHNNADLSDMNASLAYLKLIPLSEREIDRLTAERPTPDTRRLVAINDGGYLRHVRSREDIREQLEPLRDSDFRMILWGSFRGQTCLYFRTRAGRVPTGGDNEFNRFFSTYGEGMDTLRKLGVDPLREAVEYAHSIGLDLCASIRMDGSNPPPYNASPGPFFDEHPEYRCRNRNGRVIPRLSLAYPEVRNLYLAMFREALEYGVDGIAVVFGRAWPFVSYEDPVSETFRRKHGIRAQDLDVRDPRWLKHKAGYVTEYVRAIRSLLDEQGRSRGRRLNLVTLAGSTVAGSLEYGLDIETWVRESLVDHLVLHPVIGGDIRTGAAEVAKLARDSKTKVYVDLYPRRYPAEMIRRAAVEYYKAGIDGFCCWDTDGRMMRPGEFAMWRRLGHRESLESWENEGRKYFRVVPLKTFNGYEVDRSWWQSGG